MSKNKKQLNLINHKFSSRLQNIPASIISKLTKIDELKGSWISGAKLNPQVLGRLKKFVLVTSTGASTRIEGSKLLDEEIEKMMKGLSIQKFTNRDSQEARGYYELLENVFNSWKTLQINENTIKHFHGELLKYVSKDKNHKGNYKKQENKVHMINTAGESVGILFDTTPAYLTPKEIQELVEWTNFALNEKKYHSLLIISNFLVEFLKIHPFTDGNGRLSRILTNLFLLKAGYEYMPYVSHEKIVEDNKSDYYIALRRSQKTIGSKKEDITLWIEFFLTIFLEQSQIAVELLSKEKIEKLLSEKQNIVWNYIKNIDKTTVRDIVEATKINRSTVKQILEVLMRFKKIERIGQGRSTSYKRV
jgi:Fic family protein